mmetsp:Transcript_53561/g.68750  ORF Transcript_53561/g.68750 Transcript_53561/m.68750 type:complete len:696 (-) Transcript_53561:227-2314(-)
MTNLKKLLFLFLSIRSVQSDADYVVVDVDETGNVNDIVVNTQDSHTESDPSTPEATSSSDTIQVTLEDQAPESNDNILELIDKELEELDSLISLGRRKVELLGNMRKHVASGKKLPASVDMSNLEKTLSNVETRQRQPYISNAGNPSSPSASNSYSSPNSNDLLMVKADLRFNSTIVASAVMPFKSRATQRKAGTATAAGSYVSVLAMCDAEGQLMIMDADSGTLLHSVHVASSSGDYVSKISFDAGSGNEPAVVAVGTREGQVSLFVLTLWSNDMIIAGKKPRVKKDEDGEPLPNQDIPTPPAVTSDSGLGVDLKPISTFHVTTLERTAAAAVLMNAREKSGQDDGSEIELPPPKPNTGPVGVTALLIYSVRGGDMGENRRMVAVGDGSGCLFAVTVNGTLMRNATVRAGYARDIKKQGNTLAVSEDLGVSFLSLTRFAFTSSYCKGGAHPAVSLAVDVLSPGMIYVAFAGGEVVLYNSKAKGTSSKGAMMCSKVQKLNTAAMTSPGASSVHTVRGYVVVGSLNTEGVRDDGVLLFNSSNIKEMGVRYITKVNPPIGDGVDCDKDSWHASAALSVSTVIGSAKLPELLVAVTSSSMCGKAVTLYEALLHYDPPVNDISWVRMPMLAGGLALVFGWQFFKGKAAPGANMFGAGRGGRGGRGGGGEEDIAQMMASMNGASGIGRGFDTGRGGRGGY